MLRGHASGIYSRMTASSTKGLFALLFYSMRHYPRQAQAVIHHFYLLDLFQADHHRDAKKTWLLT